MNKLNLIIAAILFHNTSLLLAEERLSFEELRAFALSKSINVKEIDADFYNALGESLNVRRLKNPEFQVKFTNPNSEKTGELENSFEFEVSQSLRVSDFGSRDTVQELMEEASSLDKKLSLLELFQKFRLAYVRLWALQEKGRIFNEGKDRAIKFSKIVSKAALSGLVGKGQSLAFEAEASKQLAKLIGIKGDTFEAQASLTTFVGRSLEDVSLLKPTLSKLPDETELVSKLSDSTFPPIERQNLRLKLTQAQREVAKRDSYPSLVPKFFYSKDPDGFDEIGGGIALEIPLWNQNDGERKKAEAENLFQIAKSEYTRSDSFKNELLFARRFAEETAKQALIYQNDVVPKLREALNELSKQHEAGGSSVFELLASQRELLAAEEESLDLWVRAMSAEAELFILSGTEF